jgi:secondary thiamine-phosphate synthase enzyme
MRSGIARVIPAKSPGSAARAKLIDQADRKDNRCNNSQNAKSNFRDPGYQATNNSATGGIIATMKFHTEYLTFRTEKHREYVNITPQVESALAKSGIREGMILVSAMHITAGVWVNDAEDGLIADIDEWLEKLAPFRQDYRHHRTGETNGDSHLKNLLVHHQVIVPVTAKKLDFGPWQQIYYAEFDGQRAKRVIIKVMGE